ncbi:MAG: matrixin family metalloprotease [Opitutaceae bacterium]|nr:matrixin family metalloprotease [Opitutaceae bacterium]
MTTFVSRVSLALTAFALVAGVPAAHAYLTFGRTWAAGDVIMQLQLGTPTAPLSDGSPTWDVVAESALADWNALISRSRFVAVRASTASKAQGNRINNVFFTSNVYGEAFGTGVLAITLSYRNSRNTTESDVVFNSAKAWDSYRGVLRRNTTDFRRVALHEFGHVLGLDHPDEATPPQLLDAVMNSHVSNTENLTADDMGGILSLYPSSAAANGAPLIIAQPSSQTVQVSGNYTLNVAATGASALSYAWRFRAAGTGTSEPFLLAIGPSYTIGSVQPADAGTYTATVTNGSGTVTSNSATLTVTPLATTPDTTLVNISTRGVVGTGADMLIAGLVIRGSTPKDVVVRAVGPALADFGVGGALADPELKIINASGDLVAQNDNWESTANASNAAATFTRLGAFQFSPGSRDALVMTSLPPGNYTAQVSGVGGTTGVALVEAYDADPDAATSRSRRLVNIATRGQIGSGENVLIAGLVVSGPGPRTYLIRAAGPTLGNLGVPGAINDPFLQIYKGETLLRENDDWDAPLSAQPALREAASQVGAFPLQIRRDAAMIITLQPGSYTAKVSGFQGATGVGLVEIYEMQ